MKDCAHELAPHIAHNINLSLKYAIIPTDMKTAKVTPIYKDGEKCQFTNYRPISVLPIISKILEHCVYTQLIDHLEHHNLLSSKQFGFRKKRSTESACVIFLDHIHRAMDNSKLTGALFVDLSKAFDTVSHSSILEKLPQYGITGNEMEWFTDYLFGRTMRVNYLGTLSSPKYVQCGVPQGSILGPVLFLLHFNEVPALLRHCEILMYADDTVLYFHHHDLHEIEKALSEDLNTMSKWLEDNELILNLKKGKTEVMMFGTRARLNKQDSEIKIEYKSQQINVTDSYKYLGVGLDQTLSLNLHFNSICKKVAARIRLLRKMRLFLTDVAVIRIYQALIIPLVTYCSLTNFYHQPSRKSTLTVFENRIRKFANCHEVPTMLKMCEKKICVAVYKCLNEHYPYFENYFQRISHNFGTRNNKRLLKIPRIKLESTKRAFFYNGVLVLNGLPTEVRSEGDFVRFCGELETIF